MKKVPDIDSLTVVTDDEAELADYVVCARVGNGTPFTDNLTGACVVCDHPVMFRPHAPKRPERICMECAMATLSADEEHVITTKIQQEAVREIRKKMAN